VDISAHSNAPYLMRPVSGVDSVTASVGLGTRSNVLSILRQSQVALEVTTPLSLGVYCVTGWQSAERYGGARMASVGDLDGRLCLPVQSFGATAAA